MSSSERILHPADLIIARKALKRILVERERILALARVQKQDLEIWNKEIWSWHNDVPRDRFYYFGIGTDPKRIDPEKQYSAMIAWFESEIERVEKLLIEFYMAHEVVFAQPRSRDARGVTDQSESRPVAVKPHRRISVPLFYFFLLPAFMALLGSLIILANRQLYAIGGIFLAGSMAGFVSIYKLRRKIAI